MSQGVDHLLLCTVRIPARPDGEYLDVGEKCNQSLSKFVGFWHMHSLPNDLSDWEMFR